MKGTTAEPWPWSLMEETLLLAGVTGWPSPGGWRPASPAPPGGGHRPAGCGGSPIRSASHSWDRLLSRGPGPRGHFPSILPRRGAGLSRGKGRRRGRTGRKNAGSPAFRPLQEKAAAAGLPKCPKPGSPFCESIQKCEKRQISFAIFAQLRYDRYGSAGNVSINC